MPTPDRRSGRSYDFDERDDSISDFALTPPIEALKAIAGGTFGLTVPSAISLGVPIGLLAMMYRR